MMKLLAIAFILPLVFCQDCPKDKPMFCFAGTVCAPATVCAVSMMGCKMLKSGMTNQCPPPTPYHCGNKCWHDEPSCMGDATAAWWEQ